MRKLQPQVVATDIPSDPGGLRGPTDAAQSDGPMADGLVAPSVDPVDAAPAIHAALLGEQPRAGEPSTVNELFAQQAAQIRALVEATNRQAEALSRMAAVHRPMPVALAAPSVSITDIWAAFSKVAAVRLRSFRDDVGRAKHLLAFFGDRQAATLALADVDAYRELRRGQLTALRGTPTTPATRNREVMLLKRMLNFAVEREMILRNPIAGADDEPEDNVRETVLTEEDIAKILFRSDDMLSAFVLVAYDSGMRFTEVRTLRWAQMDPAEGAINVLRRSTKTRKPRVAELSSRAWEACRKLGEIGPHVFQNPETGKPWGQRWIHTLWDRAVTASGVVGPDGGRPWLHDLRRSYITLSRRRGIDEETIKARTGHETDAAFRRYSIVGLEDLQRAREINERHRRFEVLKAELLASERRGPQKK